ncbi:MAG: hypothetical protein JL50_10455 [Peptococcaceae bacterium BICA1-7]|nr:MAG: hypothetical protein JL50_10455 [Peptococcaceae bacterium BICA1-7]HBV95704.1 hypothetical protein [Desulfotomaculum sp.]
MNCTDLPFYIHKLNNMLTVIHGNTELMILRNGMTEEMYEILSSCKKSMEILNEMRRMSGI